MITLRDPEKAGVGPDDVGDATDSWDSSLDSGATSPPHADTGLAARQPASTDTTAAAGADTQDPVPDGGLDAWLQVLGSFIVLVDTWGLINSFGVFQTYYETKMLPSTSSADISWIGSLQGALLMLVGVVSGPLYDRGYFRQLVASGIALVVFGQFMLSICTTYWQVLLAQGIATGIGMGLVFLPSAAILAQYFSSKRALVLGISSAGSPIGGTVFPILFSRLEPKIGFGWTTRVLAFILLAISVVPLACMHTRVPPPSGCRRILDPTALRDAPFVTQVLASFFAFAVLYVPFFYLQLFAEKHNIAGPDVSPYVVTILNVGSIVGRVLPNYLADRLGSVNVIWVCGVVSAVLALGWLGVNNFAGLIIFALLYGCFSGGIVSVSPSVFISLTPDPNRVGTRMGMAFMLLGIAILVGTPIAGAIVGDFSEERWRGVIGYTAGCLLVSTALYSACRLMLYRSRGGLRA